eukprot:2936560-Heterocapsa_arctica.AAC.1
MPLQRPERTTEGQQWEHSSKARVQSISGPAGVDTRPVPPPTPHLVHPAVPKQRKQPHVFGTAVVHGFGATQAASEPLG